MQRSSPTPRRRPFPRTRIAVALGLVALTGLGLLAAFRPAAQVAPCNNILPHEPVVIYDVQGGTLAGPVDLELIVFGDGSARLSSSTSGSVDGKCLRRFPGEQAAATLLGELSALGAFALCDDPSFVSDVPLNTLTVMRAQSTARAHTFSWWIGAGAYGSIQQTLQAFIQAHFPDF